MAPAVLHRFPPWPYLPAVAPWPPSDHRPPRPARSRQGAERNSISLARGPPALAPLALPYRFSAQLPSCTPFRFFGVSILFGTPGIPWISVAHRIFFCAVCLRGIRVPIDSTLFSRGWANYFPHYAIDCVECPILCLPSSLSAFLLSADNFIVFVPKLA